MTRQQFIKSGGLTATLITAATGLLLWLTEGFLTDLKETRKQVEGNKQAIVRIETQVDERWGETNRRLGHIEAVLDDMSRRR